MLLEHGSISEVEFDKRESALLDRLDALENRNRTRRTKTSHHDAGRSVLACFSAWSMAAWPPC